MTHLTTEQLSEPIEAHVDHLETCSNCRRALPTDVDLDAVWGRVAASVGQYTRTVTPAQAAPQWPNALAALVAVMIIAIPLLLLSEEPNEAETLAPPVVQPNSGADALPPPPTPPAGSDDRSFEMVFHCW